MKARDHILEKHPDLTFINAHLGSLEWSLEELSKRLDKFPNMAVDLARMPELYLHAKNDWQRTVIFLLNTRTGFSMLLMCRSKKQMIPQQ